MSAPPPASHHAPAGCGVLSKWVPAAASSKRTSPTCVCVCVLCVCVCAVCVGVSRSHEPTRRTRDAARRPTSELWRPLVPISYDRTSPRVDEGAAHRLRRLCAYTIVFVFMVTWTLPAAAALAPLQSDIEQHHQAGETQKSSNESPLPSASSAARRADTPPLVAPPTADARGAEAMSISSIESSESESPSPRRMMRAESVFG